MRCVGCSGTSRSMLNEVVKFCDGTERQQKLTNEVAMRYK